MACAIQAAPSARRSGAHDQVAGWCTPDVLRAVFRQQLIEPVPEETIADCSRRKSVRARELLAIGNHTAPDRVPLLTRLSDNLPHGARKFRFARKRRCVSRSKRPARNLSIRIERRRRRACRARSGNIPPVHCSTEIAAGKLRGDRTCGGPEPSKWWLLSAICTGRWIFCDPSMSALK
jgi:hypothetical protein